MARPEFVRLAEELFGARAYRQDFPMVREGRRYGVEYSIPAGLSCQVCNLQDLDRKWHHHTTRRQTYAKLVVSSGVGVVVLRNQDWLLSAKVEDVRRIDGPLERGEA